MENGATRKGCRSYQRSALRNGKKDWERSGSLFNFEGSLEKQKKPSPVKAGGVAQLGEHLPCKQGVRSSILLISTRFREEGPKGRERGSEGRHSESLLTERDGLIAQPVRARA